MAVNVKRLELWQQKMHSEVLGKIVGFPLPCKDFVERMKMSSEQRWTGVSDKIEQWIKGFIFIPSLARESLDIRFLTAVEDDIKQELGCRRVFYFACSIALEMAVDLRDNEIYKNKPELLAKKVNFIENMVLSSCPPPMEEDGFEVIDNVREMAKRQYELLENWEKNPLLFFGPISSEIP